MNIFYKLPRKADKIIKDCVLSADAIILDELDCTKSPRRVKTNKTLEEILSLSKPYYKFIYRAYENQYQFVVEARENHVCYFAWINLSPAQGDIIVDRYKLNPLI